MRLRDICTTFSTFRFPRTGEDAHPDRESVLQLRYRLRDALVGDEFVVDCIAHELRLIERGSLRRSLTPFYTDPEFGVRFAFGYWPPNRAMEPHEHTAWTISAVCNNTLSVATYDRIESYRRGQLVPKNLFEAESRAVGYIFEPAIHAPRNPSNDWSLSLHVGSPRDGEPAGDFEPLPALTPPQVGWPREHDHHPYTRAVALRLSRQEADVLAGILLASDVPRAHELLPECSRLASSAMRAALRAAMPDPAPASESLRLLARVDPDLRFTLQREAPGDWCLVVETPFGPRKLLGVNDVAYDAFAFASTSVDLDVQALPGSLSDEERTAIADTLEDVGLFKAVAA